MRKKTQSWLLLPLLLASPAAFSCADMECSPPLALQLSADRCGLAGLPLNPLHWVTGVHGVPHGLREHL